MMQPTSGFTMSPQASPDFQLYVSKLRVVNFINLMMPIIENGVTYTNPISKKDTGQIRIFEQFL